MRTLFALLLAAGVLSGLPATAQAAATSTEQPRSAQAKKKQAELHEDDKTPDISASTPIDYQCELGNKVTIYRNAGDDNSIALRWKNRLLRLMRVPTTTGAHRFENGRNGLVWIDIPAKGLLLDSKKGRPLVQDCKNRGQM